MGLYKMKPPMSSRMGILYALSAVKNAALIEFGCMGHMMYGRAFLSRSGVTDGCKLYSTHIDETDIAFGDTTRIDRVLAEVMAKEKPEAVFFIPSSVPSVTGVDMHAVIDQLQPNYEATPLLFFEDGGFGKGRFTGIEEALYKLVKGLAADTAKSERITFNLIGASPDSFRFYEDAEEVRRMVSGALNAEVICTLTADTTVEQITKMGGAHVNVVLRKEGLKAAKYLEKRFGTPYYEGVPYGIAGSAEFLRGVAKAVGIEPNEDFIGNERAKAECAMVPARPMFVHLVRAHRNLVTLSVGGQLETVRGIRDFGCGELKLPAGDFWCDDRDAASEEIPYLDESKRLEAAERHPDGLLMADGELLARFNRNPSLQIANPDMKWRLCRYEAPFMGFRGACNLMNLWINAAIEADKD